MEVQIIDENALSTITKAEIYQQVATAKEFPRDLKRSINNALTIATMSPEVAESCIYSLPRGGKFIEGPTVRLAEILAHSFGNLRSGYRIVGNDGKVITAQGICHDLENNTSVTIEIQRRITNKFGDTFNQDMQVVTGNAAGAIAYRNALFKIIPQAITDNIYDKVRAVARGHESDRKERVLKAIRWFRSKGIKDEQIFSKLKIKTIEEIDLDLLQTLSGFKSAASGGANVEDLFRGKETPDQRKARLREKLKDEEKPILGEAGKIILE